MKHLNIYKRIENMKRELGDVSEKLKPYEFVDLLKDTDFEKLPIQLFESVINELKSAIKIFELEAIKDGEKDVIDTYEIAKDACDVQKLTTVALDVQEIAMDAFNVQEIAIDALDVKYSAEIESSDIYKQIVDNTNDRTISNLCCDAKIDKKDLDEKSNNEKVKDTKAINCESNLAFDFGFKPDFTQEYLTTANTLLKTINNILIHKIYTAMLKNIHNMLNSNIQNILAIMDEKDILKLKVRYLKLRKLGLESKIHCLKSTLILCQVIKQEKNLYGKIYGYDKLFECFVGSFLKTYFSVMKVDRKYEEKCEICDMIRIFVEKYVDAKEDVVYEI